ncbi:MAG: segregation/condensation protein A [Candidatus Omnitrophica bacterium CG11_big_fil_rev_8_21_14_0_20_45_26]|uniref:Segregation and condensation protein A n=2 Tax=Bacteria TaxID=2 RepID=A0A2H0LQ07_9BACT|nr:MAG: segregation/condensation protein A [Candidatus Omnitrophica bacterium CG11_big_fil_rev_8_21_14_0_20_45_26]PIW64041.1 MAG: segregation/condensation protein A [Candidatus Omnitrophica bacterium CG12_big_fil_rev_8_21_14_0_65_45_16]
MDNLDQNQPDNTRVPQAYDPLQVKIAAYEGPLELLLDLIKKNEMDIYHIEISLITKQYLEHLAQMKALNLEIAGEFLVMAATLIYIKSKMLLPNETLEDDEEGTDPREELVRKLLEYQAFKEAAKSLESMESERSRIFTRQLSDYYLKNLSPEDAGIDTFSADLYDLLQAFHSVLSQVPKIKFHEVYEEIISIEEKIDYIKQRLNTEAVVSFRQLFGEKFTRNEVIATFLALLEIVRSKFARVKQSESFGEINIERVTSS